MKELIEAAKELDLDPITQEKVHPASRIKGLIAVRKISSKEKVEKSIYEKLRKNMGKSQSENG
ncbi:hypothetical protein [Metallosphaera hakonensis]|nr:hypothetical protein [Metallosphaera hakonensis]